MRFRPDRTVTIVQFDHTQDDERIDRRTIVVPDGDLIGDVGDTEFGTYERSGAWLGANEDYGGITPAPPLRRRGCTGGAAMRK